MTTRADIVTEAREWLGTRWHHQASLKGVGCDCIGLVAGVARALKVQAAYDFDGDFKLRAYGRQPDPSALLAGCDHLMERIPKTSARLGDVLVMKFETEPQHFGIVSAIDPPYMIHAFAQARKVVEHRIDALWLSRVLRAYHLRGVAD